MRLSLQLFTLITGADVAIHAITPLAVTGWEGQVVVVTGLLAVAGIFTILWSVRPLADMAFYAALWWAFAALGCVLTYLVAAHATGFADDTLMSIDGRLSFDWPAWVGFVHGRPWLTMILNTAYMSLLFQIFGSIAIFAVVAPERNERLFLGAGLAFVVTALLSAVVPAAGPFIRFGDPSGDALYFQQVASIRTGAPNIFNLGDLQGIICFPSYHTCLALIFTMCHYGLKWSFVPVIVLNAVMLLSVPSEGGHYLVDMLIAIPVAVGSMVVAHWATPRRQRFTAQHASLPIQSQTASRAIV